MLGSVRHALATLLWRFMHFSKDAFRLSYGLPPEDDSGVVEVVGQPLRQRRRLRRTRGHTKP